MSINFQPGFNDHKRSDRGRLSIWWLFVLLLLVALLAFMYRFTDLFKPTYNAVGMYHPSNYRPLPDQGGKAATLVKPEGQHPAPGAKPALAPPAAQTPVVRPVPAKPEAKPVQKDQAGPPAASATPAKPQPKAGTPPAAVPAGGGSDASGPVKAERKAAEPGLKGGAYTLLIGEFAGGRDTAGVRTKLKKLGIAPVHEKQVKRVDQMHRLFLADFDSYQAADAELQKLRQLASGAFIATDKGKHAVYAGSYLHEKKAVAEQQRLAGKNVNLSIQTAQVTISRNRVTAGSFPDSATARKEAARLQKRGVIATVVEIAIGDSP